MRLRSTPSPATMSAVIISPSSSSSSLKSFRGVGKDSPSSVCCFFSTLDPLPELALVVPLLSPLRSASFSFLATFL